MDRAQHKAQRNGSLTFTVHFPCINGHYAPRSTRTRVCRQCERDRRFIKESLIPTSELLILRRIRRVLQKIAKSVSVPAYGAGIPCQHDHMAGYWTTTGRCITCDRINARRKYSLPVPTRAEPHNCEACGAAPRKHHLALDHDHTTGFFRGWLCNACNLGLGGIGDLSGVLQALRYLERSRPVMQNAA